MELGLLPCTPSRCSLRGARVVEHGCSVGVLFQLLVVEETRLVCLWSSGMESYFTRGLEEELGI